MKLMIFIGIVIGSTIGGWLASGAVIKSARILVFSRYSYI